MVARAAIDWSTIPLGTAPDGEIARMYAVTRQAVAYQRNKLGVAAYTGTARGGVEAATELDAALVRLLDGDRLGLSIATAAAVDLVPGWGVELSRTGRNRVMRARFRTAARRGWSEWMTARRARAWLLQAGWADAAQMRVTDLRGQGGGGQEATA